MTKKEDRDLAHGLLSGVTLGVFEMKDPQAINPAYKVTDNFWTLLRRNNRTMAGHEPIQIIIMSIIDAASPKMIEEKELQVIAAAASAMLKRHSVEGMK